MYGFILIEIMYRNHVEYFIQNYIREIVNREY